MVDYDGPCAMAREEELNNMTRMATLSVPACRYDFVGRAESTGTEPLFGLATIGLQPAES
jgi:hypothetical protein